MLLMVDSVARREYLHHSRIVSRGPAVCIQQKLNVQALHDLCHSTRDSKSRKCAAESHVVSPNFLFTATDAVVSIFSGP